MREIKFRGKRVDNSEWVYGDLIHDCNKRPLINIAGYSHLGTGIQYQGLVTPNTVGQFTGLFDKNGTEIYEGDIIGGKGLVGLVEYNTQLTQFQCTWTKYKGSTASDIHSIIYLYDDEYSFIGNIHDNPELLT